MSRRQRRHAVLEVEDIHAFYGSIEALKGISLTVNEGEIVTLIGSNGAGKSTTLRTISGLNAPRDGPDQFRGEEIHELPGHQIAGLGIASRRRAGACFSRMTVLREPRDGRLHAQRQATSATTSTTSSSSSRA